MGKLIIKRHSNYCAALLSYNILLDKEKIGVISNGKQKEFTIKGGKHTIKLKAFGMNSNTLEFSINENTEIAIDCKTGMDIKLSINYITSNIALSDAYEELNTLKRLKDKLRVILARNI